MHPKIRQDQPGHCTICGMDLVPLEKAKSTAHHMHHDATHQPKGWRAYQPLLIIAGVILLASGVVGFSYPSPTWWQAWMLNFMAGFFLVFSLFKLIDLTGFAHGYFTYDLLARRVFKYGYVYPFLELGLGLAYASRWNLPVINVLAVILLGFSGVGVARKLLKGEKFQCACLGTFLKVPLTKVTLIEDFGMVLMALIMLAL